MEMNDIINKVVLGDCIEVMKDIERNSIDLICTDPPYGIAFMGKSWDKALPNIEAFKQMNRILKPGGIAFVMSSPRQDVLWRMLQLLEKSGFELKQSFISWLFKTGFPKAFDVSKNIKNKELSKKWEGWKSITGLKPALECILMVNKPLEGKIVDNVLKYGTGSMNIDSCRIPCNWENDPTKRGWKGRHSKNIGSSGNFGITGDKALISKPHNKGRFPANLLVSDKAIDSGKISKGVKNKRGLQQDMKGNNYGRSNKKLENSNTERGYNDSGDQSRYFDLDNWYNKHIFFDVPKPSKSEKEKGLDDLKEKQAPVTNFQTTGGVNYRMENGKITNPKAPPKQSKNFHPTVKPIKLMSYLIELGCSKEGIVLDPFVGSGTTCIAAKMLKRKFIGIEVNKEYINIAAARIGCPIYEYKSSIIREVKVSKKEEKKVDWRKVFGT